VGRKSKGRKSKGHGPKGSPNPDAARRVIAERLDALYAQIPGVECKGLCAHSCRLPIRLAPGERDRISREGGVELPLAHEAHEAIPCPALQDGRCTVHKVRPMMCRRYGVDESIPCPHGCVPEGGWLSQWKAVRLTMTMYLAAGWPPDMRPLTPKQVSEYLRSDQLREHLAERMATVPTLTKRQAREGGIHRVVRVKREK
jgi:putative zinc- or iron-chelating protein